MIDLRLGNCIDLMPEIPTGSVSAVITDPPYDKSSQHLYGAIAKEAARFLEPGGSYLALLPNYAIPEVLASVGLHLKWRWMHCMWQHSGAHARMAMGIEVVWKPIGWWVKGAWPQGRGFTLDGFENTPPDKDSHKWAQGFDWASFCLNLVPAGGTVLDPLMGDGTIGIECARRGAPFIGFEQDEMHFAVASQKIERYDQEFKIITNDAREVIIQQGFCHEL